MKPVGKFTEYLENALDVLADLGHRWDIMRGINDENTEYCDEWSIPVGG